MKSVKSSEVKPKRDPRPTISFGARTVNKVIKDNGNYSYRQTIEQLSEQRSDVETKLAISESRLADYIYRCEKLEELLLAAFNQKQLPNGSRPEQGQLPLNKEKAAN